MKIDLITIYFTLLFHYRMYVELAKAYQEQIRASPYTDSRQSYFIYA